MQHNKKVKIAIALKKARTSIDKILAMMDSPQKENVCFEIIQQNLAVIGLLKSANILMLETHLDGYITNMKTQTPSSQHKQMKKIQNEVIRIVHTAQNK